MELRNKRYLPLKNSHTTVTKIFILEELKFCHVYCLGVANVPLPTCWTQLPRAGCNLSFGIRQAGGKTDVFNVITIIVTDNSPFIS